MGKASLRRQAFARDGWQVEDGSWRANCAFGCGDVLDTRTATLDRHPVMGQNGGKYTIDNVRLACAPCNSRNTNSAKAVAKKERRRQANIAANIRDEQAVSFWPRTYPTHVKTKLRDNYPSAEGRDVNGIIRMDL